METSLTHLASRQGMGVDVGVAVGVVVGSGELVAAGFGAKKVGVGGSGVISRPVTGMKGVEVGTAWVRVPDVDC
jgi:hypothetical protein